MRLLDEEYRVVNAWWDAENGELFVFFVVQINGGKKVLKLKSDLSPYFFTTDERVKERVKCLNGEFGIVRCKLPSDIVTERERYKDKFEADIPYVKRFAIDKRIDFGNLLLKRCYIDIEVEQTTRFPEPEHDKIISIALVSDEEEKFWWIGDFKDEREMLNDFFTYVLPKYSLLLGWNFLDFDFTFLVTRSRLSGLTVPCWKYVQVGDVLFMFKEIMRMYSESQASYSLGHVAEKYLDARKLERPKDWTDKEVVRRYCVMDARLAKMIDEKFGLSMLYDSIAIVANTFFEDTQSFSRVVDFMMLRYSFDEDFSKRHVHRCSEWTEEVKDTYTGAFVMTPLAGIHENVAYIDLKSLYPSIILNYNLSFDTIDFSDENIPHVVLPGNGLRVRIDRKGILPSMLNTILGLRAKYKNERKKYRPESSEYAVFDALQNACKFLSCTFYGVFGAKFFRAYDRRISEGITLTGQKIIKTIIRWLEDRGKKVIYTDTDSVFYYTDSVEDALRDVEELNFFLQETFGREIEVKLEKFFERIVFLREKKKKYFGKVIWEDGKECNYIKITGMEARRGDWCDLAREVQSRIIEMVLNGDVSNISGYLQEVKRDLYAGKLDNKLVISKGLAMTYDSYKARLSYIELAKQLNIKPGDKVQYVIIGMDKKTGRQIVGQVGSKPDYDYYWKKYVTPVANRVFEGIGISLNHNLMEFVRR
jgi:DNA polymerase I